MTDLDQLKQIPLLNQLPEEDLKSLARIVVSREYLAGEDIFYENDSAKGFFALVKGRIKIYKLSFMGKEQILHIFGPGEIFAEVAVFSDQKYPANAQALQKSTILFFPRQRFRELLTQTPDLGLHLLGLFALRLRELVAKIEELSLKEVPARLAAHLLLLLETEGKSTFSLNINKNQLAGLLGTIPETLSRVIKKFKDKGLIEMNGNVITLKDQETLKEIAQGLRRI